MNLQKEIMNKNSIINMLHRQLSYFQGPDADDDDGNDTDADAWCLHAGLLCEVGCAVGERPHIEHLH